MKLTMNILKHLGKSGSEARYLQTSVRCSLFHSGLQHGVLRRRERGASTVEFAASVVLVILMFLGMLQSAAYLWAVSIVENAARHGARAGSVSQSCAPCEAITAARAALQGQPLIENSSVSVLAPGGVVGSTVKIRVSASIPLFLPGGNTLGLEGLTSVQAEATFRQEGW
jgi:hypothetical protein